MWRHIVIEGYCFADITETNRPCGKQSVTSFCLANGKCPHLAYVDSNEREVTAFVPLKLIIWDRIKLIMASIYGQVRWYFWDKWVFYKKWVDFREYMRPHIAECPAWDNALKDARDKFPEWFEGATKEYLKGGDKDDYPER